MVQISVSKFALMSSVALFLAACSEETTTATPDAEAPASSETVAQDSGEATSSAMPAEPGEPVDYSGYEGFKKYQIKSGIIEYKLDGMRSGTETVYWDDWGVKEARYTSATLNLMGVAQDVEERLISTPDVIYTIDTKTNQAVKTKNPGVGFFKGLSEDEMTQMSKQLLEATGARRIGTEFVAEQTCEMWDVPLSGGQECIWKGIALAESGSLGGLESQRLATTVVAGIEIDEKHFALPKDVSITDNTIDPEN